MNHLRIKGRRGGQRLTVTALDKYLRNPLYAGIICEKWTNNEPIRARFKGLVSVELFNKANAGRLAIVTTDTGLKLVKPKDKQVHLKQPGNPLYPFAKVVACSYCGKPFTGSSSRGKNGKLYPAYHCCRDGHYLRVPKATFEQTLVAFASGIHIKPEYRSDICQIVLAEWQRRRHQKQSERAIIQTRIAEYQEAIKALASNMQFMKNATSIHYTEEEIAHLEQEIKELRVNAKTLDQAQPSTDQITNRTNQLLANIGNILQDQHLDNHIKALHFALLFTVIPTYEQLKNKDQASLCSVFGWKRSRLAKDVKFSVL